MDKKNTPSFRLEALDNIYVHNKSNDAKTQRQRIAKALLELGSLSTLEARKNLDVLCPAARIYELRHLDDWQITTYWQRDVTDTGAKHSVALYVLMAVPQPAQVTP